MAHVKYISILIVFKFTIAGCFYDCNVVVSIKIISIILNHQSLKFVYFREVCW